MRYCVNSLCSGNRNNPDSAQFCQSCNTALTIEGSYGHRYQLIKLLSHGHPYTEIFQAIDLTDQQTKVFKTLKDSSSLKLAELFQREAELLKSLRHRGIPRYEDYFEFLVPRAANRLLRCLVMEYFEGTNLEQWIRDKGKLEEATAIDWLKQIAIILGYVHDKKCYHRDIKPSNLLRKATAIGKDELVLLDFGIAKETENTLVNGHFVTKAYTDGYAPPEQIDGKFYPQSDFFALGRTFVHLLTGLHPNDSRLDLARWEWSTNCPQSPLISLIDRMMHNDPHQRPQSVGEVLQAIGQLNQLNQLNSQNNYHNQPNGSIGGSTGSSPATSRQTAQASSNSSSGTASTVSAGLSSQASSGTTPILPKRFRFKPWMLLLLIPTALAGGIGRITYCQSNPGGCPSSDQSSTGDNSTASQSPVSSDRLISAGGQPIDRVDPALQLPASYASLMQEGMTAYGRQDYGKAAEQFQLIRKTASDKRESRNKTEKDDALLALRNPLPLIYAANAIAWQRSQETGQQPYSIGVAMPLNEDPGVDTLRGVALIQQKAIQQGKNVEFVLANDRNLPDQAKQIAQALVKRPGILAVIGHYTSPSTCAALSVYDPANLVLISPLSTVLNLRSNCSTTQNQVFFRTTSSTAVEARTLIQFLYDPQQGSKKSNPKVAVFYNPKESDDPRTAFSPDLTEQFESQLRASGGEVLGNLIDISNPTFNVEAALQQVQDADALAILPGGQFGQPAFENAVKLIEANGGRKVVLGSNPLYLRKVFDRVSEQAGDGALVNRLIMSMDWQQQCGAPNFIKDVYQTYAYGDVNRRTALAYEAAQVLIAKLAPGINPAEMRNALATGTPIKSDVVNREIRFDAKGDPSEGTRILVTLAREEGQLKVVPLNDRCQPF